MIGFHNKSKNLLIFFVAILIGVLLGIGIIYFYKNKSNYYAVFLNNGAIYFGKLSTFPRVKLDDAVFLQVDQSGNTSVYKFKDANWGPKGPIYLNRDSIVFIAPLDNNSVLINAIEGKNFVNNPRPQQQENLQQPFAPSNNIKESTNTQ
jgi:hypothetical protein